MSTQHYEDEHDHQEQYYNDEDDDESSPIHSHIVTATLIAGACACSGAAVGRAAADVVGGARGTVTWATVDAWTSDTAIGIRTAIVCRTTTGIVTTTRRAVIGAAAHARTSCDSSSCDSSSCGSSSRISGRYGRHLTIYSRKAFLAGLHVLGVCGVS